MLICTTLSIGFKNTCEWGNAEMVAKNFQFEFKRRGATHGFPGNGRLELSWGWRKNRSTWWTWWFKVTFLGWLSDPFKGLSDLHLGDEKVTLNHLGEMIIEHNYYLLYWYILYMKVLAVYSRWELMHMMRIYNIHIYLFSEEIVSRVCILLKIQSTIHQVESQTTVFGTDLLSQETHLPRWSAKPVGKQKTYIERSGSIVLLA